MASRMKIRKDDTVKVISGKDRGKTGTVLRTDPERQRVYVQGANIQKRHQRPQQLQDTQRTSQIEGGVIEVEGPIHVSNVQLLDPSTGDPTRVGIERDGRQAQARREAFRDGDRLMPATAAKITPRLKERYQQEIAPGAHRALRLRESDAGAEGREDHAEHGRRRREAGQPRARGGPGPARRDRRPASRTSAARASRSRPSSCARRCRSASRSRCATRGCTSSSTV